MEDIITVTAAERSATWEVLARFRSPEELERAIDKLKVSGFDRGSLGMPELNPPAERATDEAGSKPIATQTGAQQKRVFYSSILGAIAALIVALIVAARGGGTAAIAIAAVIAGIVVAAVAHFVGRGFSNAAWRGQERQAAHGTLVLAVRTDSPERRTRATEVLRGVGAELL